MATVLEREPSGAPPSGPEIHTLQDLVDIPLSRIRATPPPGSATLEDSPRVDQVEVQS